MSKPTNNILHRTPWWLLTASGFGVLLLLLLLAVPFNVLRLENRADTGPERRAIQHEIDVAFGINALGVADTVVRTIQRLGDDPVRRAELDRVLDEIAHARADVASGTVPKRGVRKETTTTVDGVVTEHRIESGNEPSRQSLDELNRLGELRDAEHDAAIRDLGIAVDARREIERARDELQHELEARDLPSAEMPKTLAQRLESAKELEHKAQVQVDTARRELKLAVERSAQMSNEIASDEIDAATSAITPALRAKIQTTVANDFYRMVACVVLILLFIPTFMLVVIAKVYVGRSRNLQKIADEKSSEAQHHSMSRQLTEARLQTLQAQVEPHFLYNTLANVQALIEIDPPQANVMVAHLIDYLRAALPKMRESASTVNQEMELVRAYLNILKMRMGERLEFAIEIDPAAANCAMPPLMLPSLVENAIKHGLEPLREGGRIEISARLENARLIVSVKDNGRGLSLVKPPHGDGVGVANIRERLAGLYAGKAELTLEDNMPRGVNASISLPLGSAAATALASAAPANRTSSAAPESHGLASAQASSAAPASKSTKLRNFLSAAHSIWTRVMTTFYVGLMAAIAVFFVVIWVGNFTGAFPMELGVDKIYGADIGNLELVGAGGAALTALMLAAVYGLLSLVMLVVSFILYCVGFVVFGALLIVAVALVVSIVAPILPFALVGWIIYMLVKRRKS